MTESKRLEVTCPKCGGRDDVEIWLRIDSGDAPDEAQWLIDGFLFEFACPDCGNVSILNHDCLYHDTASKLYVYYVSRPDKAPAAREELARYHDEGATVRLVGSRYELREKAAIARDGLDDRVVELLKFLVFNKFVADGNLDASFTAYYGALDDEGGIVVEFVDGKGDPFQTSVPRDLYDSAAEQVAHVEGPDADSLIVDRPWAARVYDQLNNGRGE